MILSKDKWRKFDDNYFLISLRVKSLDLEYLQNLLSSYFLGDCLY